MFISILEYVYEYIGELILGYLSKFLSILEYVYEYWSMFMSILEYVYEYIGVCL